MADVFYRLRIRNAADTADEIVVTSVRGGTNPYVLEPPQGDGQSFDPLTGEVMTGSYSFQIIDADITATNRVITGVLADASARQQLLSRKAFVETSSDGAAWSILVPGYVTAVRMPSAIVAEIQVGQTRRVEATRTIFRNDQSYFNQITNLIGGPIRGGWGPVRDQGGWRVRVNQINATYNYVQLKTLEAFDPRRIGMKFYNGQVPSHVLRETQELARPYFRRVANWDGARIRGWFPGLFYRVQNLDGTLNTFKTALAEPQENGHPEDLITRSTNPSFWLDWAPAGAISVGQQFDLYLYPGEVSENNPLHILAHPVDIIERLWIENGIAYDAAVLPALKDLIGPTRQLMLRITAAWKLGEFLKRVVYGPFGLATRIDSQGRQVLFSTRIKTSTTPVKVIALADLADAESTIFDLDDSTVANRVTFRTERYSELVDFPTEETATPDAVYVTPVSVTVDNGDPAAGYSDREIVYDIPGTMAIASVDLEQFVTGVGREIFDRFGRGAIGSELNCLSSVDAVLGEEVQLNLPHLPNAVPGATPVSQRGGIRLVQVVQRTETPHGPVLKVLDSGTSAQASTAPTLSIAAGADTRKVAVITITNAAALAAAGLLVRLELGRGAVQPAAGDLLTIADPAAVTSVTTPAQDAGTRLWVRARSEKNGQRPSAWSAWVNVQLAALNAVTGLSVSAEVAADRSRRLLTWAVGANATDMPVEVLTNQAGEAARTVALLPAGSTQYELRALDAATRTATVRHREASPFGGVSADATVSVVTNAGARTLAAPTDPSGFAGKVGNGGGLVIDGTFGLDVTATEVPSGVEVQVAVGAGAFATLDIVDAVQGERTRWAGVAANDGQARRIRARHVATGATESAWTDEVTVEPWGAVPPATPLEPGQAADIDGWIELEVAHDSGTQVRDEEEVRGGRGGPRYPGQAYDTNPWYDDTGGLLLFNPSTRRITGDLGYTDGTGINSLKPAEAGANVTETRTSSDVQTGAGKAVLEVGANKTETRTSADTSAVDGTAAGTVKGGAVRANTGLTGAGVVNLGVPRTHAIPNVPGIDLTSGLVDKATASDTGEMLAGLRDTSRGAASGVNAGAREEQVRAGRGGVEFTGQAYGTLPLYDATGASLHFDPATGQFRATTLLPATAIAKTVRMATTQFCTANPATDPAQYEAHSITLTAAAAVNFHAWVPLPAGATLTAWRFRGTRASGNGSVGVVLKEITGDASTTTISSLSHSTTGYQTVSASLSQVVGTNAFAVTINIDTVSATNFNSNNVLWVEFDYTIADYKVGI